MISSVALNPNWKSDGTCEASPSRNFSLGNRCRGIINGIDVKAGRTLLNCQAPLAEMFGYSREIYF
ncbi:MAG: hypothetical protein ABSC01_04485 [Verrucomicrobiota bacterium]